MSPDNDPDGYSFVEDSWVPLTEGDWEGFATGNGKDPAWRAYQNVEGFFSEPYGGRESLVPDRPSDEDTFCEEVRIPQEQPPTVADGDLLIHPKHEDDALAWMIDNADAFLQKSLRLFGSGNEEAVPDFSAWLHNHGLVDSVNSSEMTTAYGNHIHGVGVNKDLFQGLEDKMTVTVAEVRERSDDAVSYIDGRIDGLNEFLAEADKVVEVTQTSPTPAVDGAQVGVASTTTSRRIHPRYREFLEGEILEAIEEVEAKIREVAAANENADADGPEYDPSLPTNSSDPAGPSGSATPSGSAAPVQSAAVDPAVGATDVAEAAVNDDLGGGLDGGLGADVTDTSTAEGTGPDSVGSSGADVADARGPSAEQQTSGTGVGSANQSAGAAGAGGLSSMLPMMMMPMMMLPQMVAQMMQRGHDNETEHSDREDERGRGAAGGEQAAAPPPSEADVAAGPPPREPEPETQPTPPDGAPQEDPSAVEQATNSEPGAADGVDAPVAAEEVGTRA